MALLKEFKAFALRGNIVDMAVGIIIGIAFARIISSLINDIIMPPIGLLMGDVDFSKLAITLSEKTAEAEAVTIRYGLFINNVLDSLVVIFCIFLIVKGMTGRQNQATAAPSTKECPKCCSRIALKATRCPQCTADLDAT